jgi:hypothetical protein
VRAPGKESRQPPTPWFVPALIVGWGLIGVGVWSALNNSAEADPRALLELIVTFDLLHDLVFAPLLIAGAWLITRLLPAPARGPARVGGALTVLILLFSRPLVAGWGRRPTNSSTLPHDYGRTVQLLLLAVWAAIVVSVAIRMAQRRRRPDSVVPDGGGTETTS